MVLLARHIPKWYCRVTPRTTKELEMARRRKIRKRRSRRIFTRGALRVHKKNMPRTVMRGGYRL